MRWTPRRSCSWTRSAGSPCCRRTGTAPSSLGTCSPSGHVPGTGFGNSFLVFSNLVGRLFRRLVLELIQRATIFCDRVVLIFLIIYSCKFTFDRSMIIFNRFIDIFVSLLFRLLSYRRRNLLNSFKSFHNQGMILRRFTLIVEKRPSLLLRFNYQFLRISLFYFSSCF